MKRFFLCTSMLLISGLNGAAGVLPEVERSVIETLPTAESLLVTYGKDLLTQKFPTGLPPVTSGDVERLGELLSIKIPEELSWFGMRFGSQTFPARNIVMLQGIFHEATIAMVEEAWEAGVPKAYFPFCEDNGDYYCIKLEDGTVHVWSHDLESFEPECWSSFKIWVEVDWAPLLKS